MFQISNDFWMWKPNFVSPINHFEFRHVNNSTQLSHLDLVYNLWVVACHPANPERIQLLDAYNIHTHKCIQTHHTWLHIERAYRGICSRGVFNQWTVAVLYLMPIHKSQIAHHSAFTNDRSAQVQVINSRIIHPLCVQMIFHLFSRNASTALSLQFQCIQA